MADDQEVLRFYQLDTFRPEVWPTDHIVGDTGSHGRQRESSAYRNSQRASTTASERVASSAHDAASIQTRTDSIHSSDRGTMVYVQRMTDQTKDWDPLGIKQSVFTSIPVLTKITTEGGDVGPESKEKELKAKFSVSNRRFSPRQFLYEVHKDSTHEELSTGLKNLRLLVDQRSVALKGLVQNNFDRFVSARSKIDVLDRDLRGRDTDGSGSYGTAALEGTLGAAAECAGETYGPIVQSRLRAEQVRNTLSFVKRYRFFFQLPHNLREFIKHEKFEAAVREYHKGKELYHSLIVTQPTPYGQSGKSKAPLPRSTDSNLADGAPTGGLKTEVSPALKRIFDKVWEAVDITIAELNKALFKHLSQPWQSVESQEKVIGYVLDIGAEQAKDPVMYYLQSQLEWINERLTTVHANYIEKVDHMIQNYHERMRPAGSAGADSDDSNPTAGFYRRSQEFLKALRVKDTSEYDVLFSKDLAYRRWRSAMNCVKQLSSVLTQHLPDFWKLAKLFMDEQFSGTDPTRSGKRGGVTGANKKQFQSMAQQIVDLFIVLVSDVFKLSDPTYSALPLNSGSDGSRSGVSPGCLASRLKVQLRATVVGHPVLDAVTSGSNEESQVSMESTGTQRVTSSRATGGSSNSPATIDYPDTHCLIAGHFLSGVIESLVTTANDTIRLHVSYGVHEAFAEWILTMKSAVLHRLCRAWMSDSKGLYVYEDWVIEDVTLKNKVFKITKGKVVYPSLATTRLLSLFHDLQSQMLQVLMSIYRSVLIQSSGPNDQTTSGNNVAGSSAYPAFNPAELGPLPKAVISGGVTSPQSGGGSNAQSPAILPPPRSGQQRRSVRTSDSLIQPIKMAFFGTLYTFLDSLHYLATTALHGTGTNTPSLTGLVSNTSDADSSSMGLSELSRWSITSTIVGSEPDILESLPSRHYYHHHQRARLDQANHRSLLLTLCNLIEMRTTLFPAQLDFFIKAFQTQAAREKNLLTRTMRRLDGLLFDRYVLHKTQHLTDIVRHGVLGNGFNWCLESTPQDIQPYVNEALLFMVFIHAEITTITLKPGTLLSRTLQVLSLNLSQELLDSFRWIDSFSEAGALQATLECHLCERTLKKYLDEAARENLQLLKGYLNTMAARSATQSKTTAASPGGDRSSPNATASAFSPEEWRVMLDILEQVQHRTMVQFRCLAGETTASK
ncbi:Exocyst complex component S5 [Dispira parvispora]|uniref:Exocyst complex component SEC5 n=1 Tax=Dispira parvispora TaxID=1520584 RepID=A0A9W8APW5_9FUNG|nr:Exocyst complex component S5 [Dispira parvispora]